MRLTKRLEKSFKLAESKLDEYNLNLVCPIDIIYGILLEDSGVVEEVNGILKAKHNKLNEIIQIMDRSNNRLENSWFSRDISEELIEIFRLAKDYMKRYGQIYLNIGHVIKAIFQCDALTTSLFTQEEIDFILESTTECRDLKVNLSNNNDFAKNIDCEYEIYRGNIETKNIINEFITTEFSIHWAESVLKGINNSESSVFYVTDKNEIIGFGAYNVISDGVFGPMGVSNKHRSKNVGKLILNTILNDMRNLGYKEVIINDAGPIEFYERMCGAKYISMKK